MTKRKLLLQYLKIAVAVVVVTAFAALSVGCSFLRGLGSGNIEFTRNNLALQVGDAFNLADILKTDSDSYEVSSSDSRIVSVDENSLVITAVSAGTAYITAENSFVSDELKVVVTEKDFDGVTVVAHGELVQTVDSTSSVRLSAQVTGEPSKSDNVYWYVNGKMVERLGKNESFEYYPTALGEYSVIAVCGGYSSDPIVIRVLSAVTATVDCIGSLEQEEGPFTDIIFMVIVTGDDGDTYYQYLEDGVVLYEGELGIFTYKPTAGRHTLSVKVNGQTEFEQLAYFRGGIAPVLSGLDFDNLYPHAYLRYNAAGKVKVEITHPVSGAVEYSQNDTKYSKLFSEDGFDAGELIDLCAADSMRRTYKFRVKSLGDGDMLTESEYSDYVTFTQLPHAAEKYVKTVLPCGDLYVTSEKEYVRISEYYVFFRQKTANVNVSYDCYIGYNRSGSAMDLWNETFPIAATSGLYSSITATDNNGVMRTSFTVNTVNAPTTQIRSGDRAEELHAILPHINYDKSKNRPEDYSFAIDKKERKVAVEYSDELYLAVQNGVKPLPKAGSAAQVVYEQARSVLRSICTDDMTDVQKAHAIYDWIMWTVTYDTPATLINSGSEKHAAYYLEGVFGDGKTPIGGVAYSPYSVCDGISKAYSLMCNMEGIPCVRVVGRAGKDLRSAGGHAWNKVFVNGAWYFVDCTWGDSHATFSLTGGAAKEYELAMHSYLFLTDAQVADTHFEPYRYADTTIKYAPETAKAPLNIYTDLDYNGVVINSSVTKNENQLNRVREISTAFANAYKKRDTIDVAGGASGGTYTVGYQALEIYAEAGFTVSENTLISAATSAIRSVHRSASIKTLILDNCILVLVKA